ncbi:MAG TPA: WecB/TagA/CpsF family glycosyltransferase [Tepidisphaeraceae bacterium]|jgi:N-acetylglucosaminyldiphosphoundecaprenol N-acetyl-beta-D-mannosaminyltransferase
MYRRYGEITWEGTEASASGSAASGVIVAERPKTSARPTGAPRRVRPKLPTVRLLGVQLHAITEQIAINYILNELDAGSGGVVVTPNLDHLRRCTRDLSFGALVAEADLVVPDGMPLIWASRLQGTPLPQRVAGSDLISSLSVAAAKRGRSIFLLGGAPGTAEAAAKILQFGEPSLKVAGHYCPSFGFEKNDNEIGKIINMLASAQPDIIFVALGSPKQEYLIQRIRKFLPNAWWLGVGVSFSFLCGDVKRAPRWMQTSGLEWIHRFAQEPRRLFHRYIVVGVPFGTRLIARAAMRGMANRFRKHKGTVSQIISEKITVPAVGNGHPVVEAPAVLRSRSRMSRTVDGASVDLPLSSASHPRNLSRLRAVVLLGGSVRSTALSESISRSLLDLPLDSNGSIFNHWLAHSADLARHAGLERLPVRVMVNRNTPEPVSATPPHYGAFRVERDLSEYRGTGGILRDLAVDYSDDDLILVCNGSQVLLDPLAAIATALDRKHGDVTLISHNDGTPSGVMLITCKTLRVIPDQGFVDMKEQALPAIAKEYDVTVIHRRRPTGLPVRTQIDYITALRHYHSRRVGKPKLSDPLAEDWLPAFSIVEQGAIVDTRAHVHDSVVLRGGIVEAGAVVVRAIVCPGGVIKKDRQAVDQLVCPIIK